MASKYLQKFPIPGSFPELLHDFSREVMRDQPDDIFEYGAAFFAALDEVRNRYSTYRAPLLFGKSEAKWFLLARLLLQALNRKSPVQKQRQRQCSRMTTSNRRSLSKTYQTMRAKKTSMHRVT